MDVEDPSTRTAVSAAKPNGLSQYLELAVLGIECSRPRDAHDACRMNLQCLLDCLLRSPHSWPARAGGFVAERGQGRDAARQSSGVRPCPSPRKYAAFHRLTYYPVEAARDEGFEWEEICIYAGENPLAALGQARVSCC